MVWNLTRRFYSKHIKTNRTGTRQWLSTKSSSKELRPIDAIGIVAAVCRPSNTCTARSEGIIGINGKLPWGSLPKDRKIFEDLTRDNIIVVGRKTLLNERDGNLDHVKHARHCIVVSNSISNLDDDPRFIRKLHHGKDDSEFLKLARSLDEALDLARGLAAATGKKSDTSENPDDESLQDCMNDLDSPVCNTKYYMESNSLSLPSSSSIQCWVAGGEQLYEESLQHPSALELHLSVVDAEIDLTQNGIKRVSMFPAKDLWANEYALTSTMSFPSEPAETEAGRDDHEGRKPSFAYNIYKRID